MVKRSFKYVVIALLFMAFGVKSMAKEFVLVIDPGHGGHDAGACGAFSKEKDINLTVALELGKLVKTHCRNVKVIYTRTTDVFIPLQTRADIANKANADLFVSVHTNALPEGRIAYGSETYTLGMHRAAANLEVAKRENSVIRMESGYKMRYEGFDPSKSESYIIFEFMQDKFMKQSVFLAKSIQKYYSRAGRQNKGVHQAGFLVLRQTSMPAILTELGFISTPEEETYLNSKEGVRNLAASIYNGIAEYLEVYAKTDVKRVSIVASPKSEPNNQVKDDLPKKKEEKTSSKPSATDRKQEESNRKEPTKPQSANPPRKDEVNEAKSPTRVGKAEEDDNKKDAQSNVPVYKVQFLVSPTELPANDRQLQGLSNVSCYRDGGKTYKYTSGSTTDYNEIRRLCNKLKEKYPDAFVVAFVDGKRVSVQEALSLQKKTK
ncbi:MAG: N-acetylmuramoyl-L-alanine amidase [Bacteroidaceae bacterium]|nr:N-acetylmuramoyl-L-alanine amidase [Bacteroidaceae bacterium]